MSLRATASAPESEWKVCLLAAMSRRNTPGPINVGHPIIGGNTRRTMRSECIPPLDILLGAAKLAHGEASGNRKEVFGRTTAARLEKLLFFRDRSRLFSRCR